MDRSVSISLVTETWESDSYGVRRPTRSERKVFAQVNSVSRSEFFEGGRNGLKPELVFTMFFGDYKGESIIMYKSTAYSIYRTYLGRNDTIELYAQRRDGINVVIDPPSTDGQADTD